MKHLYLFLLLLVPLALQAQISTRQKPAIVDRDTLATDSTYYTVIPDSTLDVRTMTYSIDSLAYADNRRQHEQVSRLAITALSTDSRSDTIRIYKATLGALISNVNHVLVYDTLWVPVPILDLFTNTVDSIGVIDEGLLESNTGNLYYSGSFVVYDPFPDDMPWRIERCSGVGHPRQGDNTPTHDLYFIFQRRKFK